MIVSVLSRSPSTRYVAPCVLFSLSLLPLLLGNDSTKQHAAAVLFAFAGVGALDCARGGGVLTFFRPIVVLIFYVAISMMLGAWGHANEYMLIPRYLADYDDWKFAHVALTVILSSLTLLYTIDAHYRPERESIELENNLRIGSATALSVLILSPLLFLPLDMSAFGGAVDFGSMARSVFALFFALLVLRWRPVIRWTAYLLLIAVFATFSVHEKREAIFLILPILFVEFVQYPRRLTVGSAMMLGALSVFLLALILVMSVARGYGGFDEVDDFFSALPFVLRYINSDIFIAGVLNNIEANYLFFHAMNSIEVVIRDPDLIAFGSTLIKPLFMLLPRSIAPWKPDGMIHLYTTAFDPAYRDRGGSTPASFISELFWNFSFLWIIAVGIFGLCLIKLQTLLFEAFRSGRVYLLVFLLYAYMNLLVLMRGSGLDQYLVHQVFAGVFVFLVVFVSKLLPRRQRRIASNTS